METEKKKKKRKGFGPLEIVILTVAVGVLTFSVCQLLSIQNNYSGAREEYEKLADSFVEETAKDAAVSAASREAESAETGEKKERQIVPIRDEAAAAGGPEEPGTIAGIPAAFSVDFAGLRAVNPEIVGWIHVDALPHIHYPICKGTNNDFYLTHTFRRESNPCGAIFMDKNNAGDFSDALTFVYGHRMDDHSMFADLKALENPTLVDANPYFWIYTPEGIFCYRIFSVFEEPADSDVFAYHFENDKSFLKWAQYVRSRSAIDTHTAVAKRDKVVALSTCTTDRVRRVLVFGKCISVDRPGEDEEIPVPADEKAAGRDAADTGTAASEPSGPENTPKPVKGEAAAGASRDEGWELPHTEASDSFEEIWDTD